MSAKEKITNLRFNQDHGLFLCCTETGVRIYNLNPLAELAHFDQGTVGSVAFCEVLGRTNLIALVAGLPRPKFADNTVLIWDAKKKAFVMEAICSAPVIGVRLRKDRLVVITRQQIYVFSFPSNSERLLTCDTANNPLGLCEITANVSAEKSLIVFPGHAVGHVQLLDLNSVSTHGTSSSPITIKAHQAPITCLALNYEGTLLATASQKGTLIRVFNLARNALLVELRRGTDQATLYCINFSRIGDYLCCSSDKGTVHIFALKNVNLNRRSVLSGFSFISPYMESQWAFASFTVLPECPCVCAFGEANTIYAVCVDGSFHKYHFSDSGKCNRQAYDIFLELSLDDDM